MTFEEVNIVLNLIQTGGIVGVLTLAVVGFLRGWIYPKHVVEEFKLQIKELTDALKLANTGMERMADAWETRNSLERERLTADLERRRSGVS